MSIWLHTEDFARLASPGAVEYMEAVFNGTFRLTYLLSDWREWMETHTVGNVIPHYAWVRDMVLDDDVSSS